MTGGTVSVKKTESNKFCPCCGSDETEGAFVTIEDQYAYQGMVCLDCDESWTDLYKYAGNIQTQKEKNHDKD